MRNKIMNTIKYIFAAVAIALILPTAATAQTATGNPATTEIKEPSTDKVREIIEGLTTEQLQQLIKEAVQARLKMERDQVAAEIRRGLLYDGKDIDAALKVLHSNPANTQSDNIDRICRAFAIVDLRFGRAYKLFSASKYKEAAAAAKQAINAQQSTYLSAAKHYIHAKSIAKTGKLEDAAEAYNEILLTMPDRISLAAAAALEAAEAYEKAGRFYYALQMYAYCAKNYGLTMDDTRLAQIVKKIEQYSDLYKDPLKAVGDKMGFVQRRLAVVDSGKQTQQKQEEIIAILEDLIKTAEEQSGGQSSKNQQNQGNKKGKGQKQTAGKSPGTASGTQKPSSPAQKSYLPPGHVERPDKLSSIRPTEESGDWSKLPPRERQKIEQIRRNLMAERHRRLIGDYHTRMAEGINAE